MPENIVLAYSGGLDTSVMIHALATEHDADVTALLVDLGQPGDSIEEACQRAEANGAEQAVVVPAVEAFADGYIAPALHANALYEGAYPLATALARPLIAQALVDTAHQVGADAVAHGCTGKGNDQVRIEASVTALDPALTCLAPQRTDAMTRDQALAYAEEHDLELPELTEGAYSVDENLWGRSVEGGVIEDPTQPVPEDAYAWTTAPQKAPDEPATFEITFEHGLPVALDGQPLDLAPIAEQLNVHAGAHGIGRIDHVENRLVGIKSREVYEAPGATVLLKAKQALEQLTLPGHLSHLKPQLEATYGELVYQGLWFTPSRQALDAFFQAANQPVTGTVEIEAYKGSLTVTSRSAKGSLYDHGLASYGPEDAFDHEAASGFIQLWSLPLATWAQAEKVESGKGTAEAVAP